MRKKHRRYLTLSKIAFEEINIAASSKTLQSIGISASRMPGLSLNSENASMIHTYEPNPEAAALVKSLEEHFLSKLYITSLMGNALNITASPETFEPLLMLFQNGLDKYDGCGTLGRREEIYTLLVKALLCNNIQVNLRLIIRCNFELPFAILKKLILEAPILLVLPNFRHFIEPRNSSAAMIELDSTVARFQEARGKRSNDYNMKKNKELNELVAEIERYGQALIENLALDIQAELFFYHDLNVPKDKKTGVLERTPSKRAPKKFLDVVGVLYGRILEATTKLRMLGERLANSDLSLAIEYYYQILAIEPFKISIEQQAFSLKMGVATTNRLKELMEQKFKIYKAIIDKVGLFLKEYAPEKFRAYSKVLPRAFSENFMPEGLEHPELAEAHDKYFAYIQQMIERKKGLIKNFAIGYSDCSGWVEMVMIRFQAVMDGFLNEYHNKNISKNTDENFYNLCRLEQQLNNNTEVFFQGLRHIGVFLKSHKLMVSDQKKSIEVTQEFTTPTITAQEEIATNDRRIQWEAEQKMREARRQEKEDAEKIAARAEAQAAHEAKLKIEYEDIQKQIFHRITMADLRSMVIIKKNIK